MAMNKTLIDKEINKSRDTVDDFGEWGNLVAFVKFDVEDSDELFGLR